MFTAQELGASAVAPRVGPLTLVDAAMLAPMSGISDLGMRRAARRFGATLAFSEMVASAELVAENDEARLRAEGEGAEPHAAQLVGSEPAAMWVKRRLAPRSGLRRENWGARRRSAPASRCRSAPPGPRRTPPASRGCARQVGRDGGPAR